jgi:hypothetical protein
MLEVELRMVDSLVASVRNLVQATDQVATIQATEVALIHQDMEVALIHQIMEVAFIHQIMEVALIHQATVTEDIHHITVAEDMDLIPGVVQEEGFIDRGCFYCVCVCKGTPVNESRWR